MSGKTFTMFGKEDTTEEISGASEAALNASLGLIPRCTSYLFSELKKRETLNKIKKVETRVSIFECYIHKTIRDLLNGGKF